MICADAEPLLGACLDGELDAKTALEIDAHLAACTACADVFRKLEGLRDEIAGADLDWSAGVDLRALRASIRRRTRAAWWQRAWVRPALLAVAASIVLVMVAMPGRLRSGDIERQVIDNHVRSLLANHLIDIPSSDRHTVKPWFQGRVPFSPVVPDLTAEGFVLIGGRLDVIAGRPNAAIVYKRQNHVINLWIAEGEGLGPENASLDGYHLIRWQQNGMSYWAVSDLNVAELREFGELVRAR